MASLPSVSVVLVCLLVGFVGSSLAQLYPGFYNKTCPGLLPTVKTQVAQAIKKETRMGASLLRLHFHDCFVNGCDGSLLLDATSNFTGEKIAAPNRGSARGFEVVDKIKGAVEDVCPGVVSCADILAITARDSVVQLRGPYWDVPLGRRDATTASEAAANVSIPPPTTNLSGLIGFFQNVSLNTRDLVALSGSHTIGQARCTNFRPRIYNESGTIDASFARERQGKCPRAAGQGDNNLAPLDVRSPTEFNNDYFKNLADMKGLLHSDQQLFGGEAFAIVNEYKDNPDTFGKDFAAAMIKMGNIKPLTGNNGEIRKNCRKIN